ncbi:hypothetical protein SAMN05421505_1678 [Sinosporangium album]|uniref:Uncharacterized protein n=1 Tax=Sinosporangium album TaxID=504805 RepID=A0A1G8LFV6_9ACTN|nr:hypothetical protein [Sinosporangium album]SDI54561.1 hypothetical protein SAMN05421505_1678 [Sinosporangium album]
MRRTMFITTGLVGGLLATTVTLTVGASAASASPSITLKECEAAGGRLVNKLEPGGFFPIWSFHCHLPDGRVVPIG